MSTIAFDTLKFVQRLEKAGVSREHATAEAEALVEVFDSAGQDLATKTDIKTEITRIDNRLDSLTKEIQAIELRLTIKLGAFIAASVGTTVALVKLL